MKVAHKFGPAYRDETIVFGASRPGYPAVDVLPAKTKAWIEFMKSQGIRRVVCLLPLNQLSYYREDLLNTYREAFGTSDVCHAPIEDYRLSSVENLKILLEFLAESERLRRKTVVHCSGGSGRTGHVLAAWLVHARGLDPYSAVNAVERAEPPRNPREAVHAGNATEDELIELLSTARSERGAQHG